MKQNWLNNALAIAAIFSFRMLGLFMLIPVFTVYATHLQHATPVLIGVALGSYGLSQGLLQMPFGLLSDRFGRKFILTIGLILFALGSLWGAVTHSMYGMIFARIVQGTGAIGSVLIALLADLTPDQHRTKAMAVIGVTIGVSFSLAMVLSPALTHYFGLAGIFYLTAVLAVVGLLLLHWVIPTPVKEPFHSDTEVKPSLLREVLGNPHLLRLNAGIFCQHLILTSTFFVIPMLLQQQIQLGHLTAQWHFYLPLMVGAFLAMVPFITLAEKKGIIKQIFLGSVLIGGLCQLLLAMQAQSWLSLSLLMFMYFAAFNILEASLPSLISKQANIHSKGTAMGVYSSCQFLGIFVGGVLAGFVYASFGAVGIFLMNGLISFGWFGFSLAMQPNYYVHTLTIAHKVTHVEPALLQALNALPGVKQVSFSAPEGLIYLRVHKMHYHPHSAEQLIERDSSHGHNPHSSDIQP